MTFHERATNAFFALPEWGQRLILVALVLVLGWFTIAMARVWAQRALGRMQRLDETVRQFFLTVLVACGWVVVIVVALGVLGVDSAALLGGLAIGGFIVGFALKDVLGNFASGVMLLFYRPFRVGEVAEVGGHTGIVADIGLSLTTIRAADGRLITIPNAAVISGTIVNHTREPKRRADVDVGVAYGDNLDVAIAAIMDAVKGHPKVLPDPALDVRIMGLGDNSVNLQVRPWVQTADLWAVQAELHAVVKRAVEGAGCSIPFPQRDVHVYESSSTPPPGSAVGQSG